MSVRTSSLVFALSAVSLGTVVLSQSAHIIPDAGKQFPVLSNAATFESLTQAQIHGLDQKVSAKFENKIIHDVLKSLSNDDFEFIAQKEVFDGLNLSFVFDEVELSEVLDSIGQTVDGRWERKGQTFTLKPRTVPIVIAPMEFEQINRGALSGSRLNFKTNGQENEPKVRIRVTGPEDLRDIFDQIEIRESDGKTEYFKYNPQTKTMEQMTPEERAKIESRMKVWGEQFGKDMEKWSKEFSKGMEDWGKSFHFDSKDLTPEQRAKMEKEWQAWGEKHGMDFEKWGEEFGKHFEKWGEEFGKKWEHHFKELEGKEHHQMSKEERAKLEADLQKMQKELNLQLKDLPMKLEKLKMIPLDEEQMKKLQELQGLELKNFPNARVFKYEGNGKDFEMKSRVPVPPTVGGRGVSLDREKFSKLMKSLSNEQKELMKSRGHLLWSDLNKEQIGIIGERPEGEFTISMTIDGQTLTLKSKN